VMNVLSELRQSLILIPPLAFTMSANTGLLMTDLPHRRQILHPNL
jgi:hypothetical protein